MDWVLLGHALYPLDETWRKFIGWGSLDNGVVAQTVEILAEVECMDRHTDTGTSKADMTKSWMQTWPEVIEDKFAASEIAFYRKVS